MSNKNMETHIEINDENNVSTQDFIQDARMRRNLRMRGLEEILKCDKCDYTTTSNSQLKKHTESLHQIENKEIEMRPRFACNLCCFKTRFDVVLKQHTNINHNNKNGCSKVHNNKKKTIVPKRKKCDYCQIQFNKEETYEKNCLLQNKNKFLYPYQLKRVNLTKTCIDESCFEILSAFASRFV